MFIVLVQVRVRPEWLDRFAAAISENARVSPRVEPGCVRFEVSQVADDPCAWVFHEVYVSRDAWLRHRESPHFLAYQQVASEALLERAVTELRPVEPPTISRASGVVTG